MNEIALEDCIEWMAAYVTTEGRMPSERVAALLNRDVQPAILFHLRQYRQSQQERWASIETAPKDGRTVLLNRDGSRRVYTGVYVTAGASGWWRDTHGQQRDPSRWMPMPTAPGTAK